MDPAIHRLHTSICRNHLFIPVPVHRLVFSNILNMEFDNDRPVKPIYKTEIVYWIAVCLFYPLINYISFFHSDIRFLPPLLLISVLLFPFYFLYARVVVPSYGLTKRYIWFSVFFIILYI